MVKVEAPKPDDYYTEEDIGKRVRVIVENIAYEDIVVEVILPDGQAVIGPRLKCAHLFARFSMVPPMEYESERLRQEMEENA